jgi:hypothetical protein
MAFAKRADILTTIAIIFSMTQAKNRNISIILANIFGYAQRVMFVCLDVKIAE